MPPAVLDYNTANSQIASEYDPQIAQVNTQIGDLGRQQDAQMSALDQAKVNAFRDITNTANAKGMLFSGFTPDQQATYTGTKYLPAVANLQTSFNNTKNQLTGQINTLNANRNKEALGLVSASQKAYNDYIQQQNDNYYKQANLDLGYARLGVSQANAAAKTPTPTVQNVGSALYNQVKSNKLIGSDGHVAPATLAAMYNTWKGYGLKDADFWKNYQGLWNPKQANYGAMFNAAKNAG